MKQNHLHNLYGEQKEQLLIMVDKKGCPKGFATREKCHKGEGITHLAFMGFIIDKDNKIILAKRSSQKSLWANFWDASVVSHILPGESAESAASRRVKEEMGIKMKFKVVGTFYYFAKHNDSAENEHCFVLVGKTKNLACPNPIEIEEIKKISLEELSRKLKENSNQFTPWLQIAWEKLDLSKFL